MHLIWNETWQARLILGSMADADIVWHKIHALAVFSRVVVSAVDVRYFFQPR